MFAGQALPNPLSHLLNAAILAGRLVHQIQTWRFPGKAAAALMISSSRKAKGTVPQSASLMSETKISRGSVVEIQGLSVRNLPRRSDQAAASLIRPGLSATGLSNAPLPLHRS